MSGAAETPYSHSCRSSAHSELVAALIASAGGEKKQRLRGNPKRGEKPGDAGKWVRIARKVRQQGQLGHQFSGTQCQRECAGDGEQQPRLPAPTKAQSMNYQDDSHRQQRRRDAVNHARLEHIGKAGRSDARTTDEFKQWRAAIRNGRQDRDGHHRYQSKRMKCQMPDQHAIGEEPVENEYPDRQDGCGARGPESVPHQPVATGEPDQREQQERQLDRPHGRHQEDEKLRDRIIGHVRIGKIGKAPALAGENHGIAQRPLCKNQKYPVSRLGKCNL
jgi:hypothetical protein